jgi:hypothetical protein
MNRPEVRLVQDQQVSSNDNPNIDSWEAEQLLRKYGYQGTQHSSVPNQEETILHDPNRGLTFEQMIAREEARKRDEEARRIQQMYGPKPISFDGRNGYHAETRYGSDDDSGYGFKVEITSDMPIPKRY